METNFKVDVPSFALGFNTGKKKGGSGGGGSAVLTELTVTENKVYDNPVMYIPTDPDTIGIGSKLRFREKITLSQETVDKIEPCAHNYFYGGVGINLYYPENDPPWGGAYILELFDDGEYALYVPAGNIAFGYVSSPNVNSNINYEAWQMEAHKWYFMDDGKVSPSEPPSFTVEYEQNINFDSAFSNPTSTERLKMLANDCLTTEVAIDGWNKVKIGIPGAGLIIDKGNIFDVLDMPPWDAKVGAIYRIVEMVDGATLYLNTGSEIIDVFADIQVAWNASFNILVVDEIPQPDDSIPMENIYILRGTGESYYINNGEVFNMLNTDIKPYYSYTYGTDFEFRGVVGSTDEITELGFYTVFGLKEKVQHYCIADNNVPVWRLNYETNGWDQLMTYDQWMDQLHNQ